MASETIITPRGATRAAFVATLLAGFLGTIQHEPQNGRPECLIILDATTEDMRAAATALPSSTIAPLILSASNSDAA
jgi:hypothetical protein